MVLTIIPPPLARAVTSEMAALWFLHRPCAYTEIEDPQSNATSRDQATGDFVVIDKMATAIDVGGVTERAARYHLSEYGIVADADINAADQGDAVAIALPIERQPLRQLQDFPRPSRADELRAPGAPQSHAHPAWATCWDTAPAKKELPTWSARHQMN